MVGPKRGLQQVDIKKVQLVRATENQIFMFPSSILFFISCLNIFFRLPREAVIVKYKPDPKKVHRNLVAASIEHVNCLRKLRIVS